jgi:predicted DNA-binding transcriptional regulator AlpA
VTEDIKELVEKTVQELLRAREPNEHTLWTKEDIAEYLRVSPRTAAEIYAPQPTFPRAIRPGGGHPRWKALEVIEWAEKSRDKKVPV